MDTVRTPEVAEPAPNPADGRRLPSVSPVKAALFAVFIIVAFLLPGRLNSYWLLVMTGVVIYSIVTLGLGVLIGRVGMVSLCQFVLAAIGAWVALRLSYATDLPFPLLILIGGRRHRGASARSSVCPPCDCPASTWP